MLSNNAAYDKQKDLLSSETGHFSLIRAMHLADLITELNGKQAFPPRICSVSLLAWGMWRDILANRFSVFPSRLLWYYVRLLLPQLLSRRTYLSWKCIRRAGLFAVWAFFRFHGRQGCALEEQE